MLATSSCCSLQLSSLHLKFVLSKWRIQWGIYTNIWAVIEDDCTSKGMSLKTGDLAFLFWKEEKLSTTLMKRSFASTENLPSTKTRSSTTSREKWMAGSFFSMSASLMQALWTRYSICLHSHSETKLNGWRLFLMLFIAVSNWSTNQSCGWTRSIRQWTCLWSTSATTAVAVVVAITIVASSTWIMATC